MLPVITIIGRPNVGKSTLFNRFTRTRDAIVGDQPGITRDRHYGEGHFEGRDFIVVDTGGIAEADDTAMGAMTEQQVDIAIQEANVILFMVDASAGVTTGDQAIVKKLRAQSDKGVHSKVVLVANKSDREISQITNAEFYTLGFKRLHALSASTGRGVNALLSDILSPFPVPEATKAEIARTRIAVVGRPNVGKSTLINRIFGEERVIVFDRPGTTRDTIEIPFDRRDKQYTLIDTAGIRRRKQIAEGVEIFSVIKAMQAMRQAHVVIVVLDASEGVTEQDRRLMGLAIEAGNALVLAFNKWDGLTEDDRNRFKDEVDRKLPFVKFARRYFISAKHGTGVGQLMDAVEETQRALNQPFSTHQLTEILMSAVETHQPPLSGGRRVKLRYAHVGALKPLTFVIHGKQADKLPESYKIFLIHYFQQALRLVGIPLILKFLTDENPYQEK
ncbi:MAG: ribosome biogenesis GTPase Der [Gammaproteobacteria bacterium RIFCSPHIGHO2_12_FULL_42_13]|nr:MAG: ribosome biogenesis GTPase Der [Gammaproteobacteria bacterium RIFCSPHIGHO2_12_FULL_42_13]